MGKKDRSSQKKVYKRNSQRVYVKGHASASNKEQIMDRIARIVAMVFYPFYLLVTKVSKMHKSTRGFDFKEQGSKLLEIIKNWDFSKIKQLNFTKVKDGLKTLGTRIKNANYKDIFNKYLSFVNGHKLVVSGVVMTLVIGIIGVQVIAGYQSVDITAEAPTASHVVSVASAESDDPKALTELPNVPDISFAAVRAYEVVVNGNVLTHFKTKEECDTLLDELVSMYTNDEGSEILDWYYSEQVNVVKGFVPLTSFDGYDDVDTMLAYVVKGTKEEKTHEVQKGENYWVIAQYYGIQPSDLEAANPNVKPETLQIGQTISLVVPKPLISVCTVERAEYTDSIPFEVTYEDTSSLYKDESKVKVKGVEGERAIVANVIKENGRELSRTILEETIISEPTTKVVYQGTKDPPPRMGTGNLIRPASRGSVTSEFGYRWGARHEGIDIGLPVGSDVKAADGGVVTFAGYSSSYGYYITIDHGGNIVTLYGHCSKLKVSKGDKVYQGQVIALSGNTGRSTGPHLHFEVRVNGTPVDPRKYVTF